VVGMLNKINGLRKCAQIVNSLKTLSLGVKYIIPKSRHLLKFVVNIDNFHVRETEA
jgi:hypothetical protein